MARRRLDVREAAEQLGITVDAVRKRIQRGSLEAEKEDGTVYVWLDTGQPQAQVEGSELVEAYREQVSYLREQLRREQDAHAEARRIIAALTQRIPELEAPSEPSGGPQSAAGGASREEVPLDGEEAQEGAERVPWWRRVFERTRRGFIQR